MTQAEVIELINTKRNTLEQHKAGNPAISDSLMKILEDEIQELETSLTNADSSSEETTQVFLDECAG